MSIFVQFGSNFGPFESPNCVQFKDKFELILTLMFILKYCLNWPFSLLKGTLLVAPFASLLIKFWIFADSLMGIGCSKKAESF